MDYRKMTHSQVMNEYDKVVVDYHTTENRRRAEAAKTKRDAIMAELARRDAMLAAAGKMVEAAKRIREAIRYKDSSYMHWSWNEDAHLADITITIKDARVIESALSAYRAAEGGAT